MMTSSSSVSDPKTSGSARASPADVQAAYDAVVRLLARRAMSQAEVLSHLATRGYATELSHAVLERLRALGYVADEQVAQTIARRAMREGRGPAWAQQQLDARRVDTRAGATVVSELAGQELSLATRIVAARWPHGRPNDRAEIAKLARRLARRGFSQDVIYRVLGLSED